ncbi:twin-arginine translocase TatA/TatE family subunit [Frondihabitans cladoniiphilus]|uniref:Sec-independent protein translocase protein TatA n=1 Tax=Frondihabitans cladoniiphilus TaxID=715785 RepID=A0ABP8W3W8_9MICO
MLRDLGGWHLLIILGIVVLLFGATKLPALARGVGQSMRIFKSEMKADEKAAPATAAAATAAAAPAPATQAPAPTVAPATPVVSVVAPPTSQEQHPGL